jgi:anti-sigma regulatory factor (Ser/Thr protein kinase)
MNNAAPSLLIPMTADIGGLEIARLQARQFLENNRVDEHTVAGVELIIEEAVTNTLRHGYGATAAEDHQVELELQIEPHEVRLLIVDDAGPFDPMDADALLLPETLDEAPVGGLGLLMIRNTASSMAYERRDGYNRFLATVTRRGPDGELL